METLLKFIENDEQQLIQSQRQIQAEIRKLKEKEQEIQNKLDDYFLVQAQKNVGRCFSINSHSFGKIINIPKRMPKLDGRFYFNRYQYPALIIDTKEDIPCWNLAALLGVLPRYIDLDMYDTFLHIYPTQNLGWVVEYSNNNDNIDFSFDNKNLIDACYEMILKLYKLKLL